MTKFQLKTTDDSWAYYNPVQLLFAPGSLNSLPRHISGDRVLVVTTAGFARRGLVDRVRKLLGPLHVDVMADVQPNPELEHIEQRIDCIATAVPDVIVAIGGGSVLDTAKVLSALLVMPEQDLSLREHLYGDGRELVGSGVPVIAVPTTAGTGSEVTPFSTIWDGSTKKKYSLFGPMLFPQMALLDPELTVSLPLDTTVITSLDALSQALESIWNRNAIPLTILYATEALKTGIATLKRLVGDLSNTALRAKMMHASLLAGLAISHTRTALAHSMSYPITMHYGMPHGLACSFTLPAIMQFNAEEDDGRLEKLAQAVGAPTVRQLHAQIVDLMEMLGVNSLVQKYVTSLGQLHELIPEMITPGRADNNMRTASPEDLRRILEATGHG